jgi:TetR/AcrR family transcriptional regulator, ethionamide resistance regulator
MIARVSSASQRLRHREQRESTRREILIAADRILRDGPYRELSVETVMAQTGLTRTAFYRHFDDVTDLVLRLFADVGRELYVVGERWMCGAGEDYPTAALEGLAGIVDFFVEHGPLVRAITEAAATDEQIERAYRASIETFIDMTAQALDRLVEAGRLQVSHTHALAQALTLMNEAYLLEEFGRAPGGDPAVALQTLQTIWIRVAGPQAGDADLAGETLQTVSLEVPEPGPASEESR